MDSKIECPLIVLSSGQTLKIRKIRLFEETLVNEIVMLRSQALRGMGGVSTGISFWGSPSWALGGAAALGLVEGLLSAAARKQSLQLIDAANLKIKNLSEGSVYFPTEAIINSNSPHPQTWSASKEISVDVSRMAKWEINNLLERHKVSNSAIVKGQFALRKNYVHDGDDFVHVETDVGTMFIRWQQHVVAYYPPQ